LSNIIATISKSDNDVTDEIYHQVDSDPRSSVDADMKLFLQDNNFDDSQPISNELSNNDLQALDDFLGIVALDDLIEFLGTFNTRILPDQEGGKLRSRNSQGRPGLENWYSYFGKRPTLLAVILDPTGKHFDEYWRGNRERARL